MTDNLQSFTAWGMVSVSDEQITVILSAVTRSGEPINRTVRQKSEHLLGFTGSALVACDISGCHMQGIHEIGETPIMGHPDVEKVFQSAVNWLNISAK
jgi:hypothetical protein